MNIYNIVLKDAEGVQQQFGTSGSTWQNAVDAAKEKAGLKASPETDENLLIVQLTGTLHVTGK